MKPSYRWLPELLGLDEPELREIKQALSQRGINARGWRLYADFGDQMFAPFDGLLCSAQDAVQADPLAQALGLLKLLAACETDVLPPLDLLQSIVDWQLPSHDVTLIPAGLLRALWKACVAVQFAVEAPLALVRFVRDEVVPCMRWYFHAGMHLEQAASWRNAPWSTICVRWHRAMHAQLTSGQVRRAEPLLGAQWPVFVARVEYQGVVLQVLHNATMLQEEGRALSHCVGGYARLCDGSMLRIYAMTDKRSGERLGTVSMQEKSPGCWLVDELHGPSNMKVSTVVQEAADAMVRSLQDAYECDATIRTQMQEQRARKQSRPCDFLDDLLLMLDEI